MTEKQSYIRGCLFAISKMESNYYSRLEDIGTGYEQIDIPWKKITDWLKTEYEKELSDRPNGKWIPVSERLPEIHRDVILSLRSLDIEVGFRAETEPYFYCHGADGCYIEPQNVLAWQPLPEPYNAESEG